MDLGANNCYRTYSGAFQYAWFLGWQLSSGQAGLVYKSHLFNIKFCYQFCSGSSMAPLGIVFQSAPVIVRTVQRHMFFVLH